MEANFGQQTTEAPQVQNFATPKEGVVERPAFLEGLTGLFETAEDLLVSRNAAKGEQTLADFTNRQLLVADALEQGRIQSSLHARTMMRTNLIAAIEANPALAGDLVKAQSSILSLSGGAAIVDEGSREEQLRFAREEQLINSNLMGHDATEEEFQLADRTAQIAEQAQIRHTERMNTIDAQLKNIQLSSEQRKALEAEREAETRRFMVDTAPATFQSVKNQYLDVLSGAGSETEKVQAIEDLHTQFLSQTTALVGNLSDHESSALLKPFELLQEQFIRRARGEDSDSELQRNIQRSLDLQKRIALSDPTTARLAVASELFNDQILLRTIVNADQRVFDSALNFLSGNTEENQESPPSPFTADNPTQSGFEMYFDSVVRGLNSGDESMKGEAGVHMLNLLNSFEEFEGLLRKDATTGITPVRLLASPEFLEARRANPEQFNNIDGAVDVLKRHYGDEVWGMVRNEFRENNIQLPPAEQAGGFGMMGGVGTEQTAVGTTLQIKNAVQVRTSDSGMEFFTQSDEPSIQREAQRLNRELKPVINNTIKAFAHLEGHSNYGQSWETVQQDLLSGQSPNNAAQDPSDNLTLRDFQTGAGVLDQAMTEGGFVGTGDFSNANTPMEVAASFNGFTETEHRSVLSRFIEQTTGGHIDPLKTAWCAAFVNAALGAKGIEGTGRLNARSFLEGGDPVSDPVQGDVVVFSRGAPSGWQGHVGFYAGPSEREGFIRVLGGNQGDKVSVRDYPINRLLGYRRYDIDQDAVPTSQPSPEDAIIEANGGNPQDTPSFRDEAEAQAALDRGAISVGDITIINGQAVRIEDNGS